MTIYWWFTLRLEVFVKTFIETCCCFPRVCCWTRISYSINSTFITIQFAIDFVKQWKAIRIVILIYIYKKAEHKLFDWSAVFAKDANVLDKMEINAGNKCFVTLNDHKENFENNPKTRLINRAKNGVGSFKAAVGLWGAVSPPLEKF